jgi:hypothetical protein
LLHDASRMLLIAFWLTREVLIASLIHKIHSAASTPISSTHACH